MVNGNDRLFREQNDPAPAVISPEHVTPVDEELPHTAYVPCERIHQRTEPVTLTLMRLADGNTAMLAYTSPGALAESCGNGHPWIAVHGDFVDELRQRSESDVVLWDAAMPIEQRRSGEEGT